MKGVASIITFTDSSFYKKYQVELKYMTDILWTGRLGFGDNPVRNEVIEFLGRLHGCNVKIAGLRDWLGYPEYLYYINGTKIGIGSNSFNRPKYSSDRLGNYMACGTFYLPQYFEGIEKVFTRKVNIDWFYNVDELEEKIKYYLANDSLRKDIASKGQEFILKHFDCKPLVSNLLHIIKTGNSLYPWDNVYKNEKTR